MKKKPETLADRLRSEMKKKGMTQSQLATRAIMKDCKIHKWLHGAIPRADADLARVAAALGVTVDYLISG